MIAHLADAPLGHLADDTDGFTVQTLVAGTANHTGVGHLAVNAHDETAQDAPLDALLVGVIGILTVLVDEVDEATLTARELRLDIHIVKLIDLHVRLL